MKIWQCIVLGLVQGMTEFLPVSSSGHLLLLEKLGIGEENLFFNICLHIGTLIAVLIAMRKTWIPLARHPFNKTNLYILIASIPTIIIAVLLKVFCPSLIDGKYLAFGFMLTTILLFACEKCKMTQTAVYNAKISILTGVMQGIAVLPGISRSGSTIATSTFLGIEKSDSTQFSFLLSIPIIIGSALYETIELTLNSTIGNIDIIGVSLGSVVAFVSGYFSLTLFMDFVKKHSLIAFACYTALLSIGVMLLQFFGVIS